MNSRLMGQRSLPSLVAELKNKKDVLRNDAIGQLSELGLKWSGPSVNFVKTRHQLQRKVWTVRSTHTFLCTCFVHPSTISLHVLCQIVSSDHSSSLCVVCIKKSVPTGFTLCVSWVLVRIMNNDNEPPSLILFSRKTDEKLVFNKCWPYCTCAVTCRTHASMPPGCVATTPFCQLWFVCSRRHLAVWPVCELHSVGSWRHLVSFFQLNMNNGTMVKAAPRTSFGKSTWWERETNYGEFSVSKFERSYTILMRSVRNFMRSVS